MKVVGSVFLSFAASLLWGAGVAVVQAHSHHHHHEQGHGDHDARDLLTGRTCGFKDPDPSVVALDESKLGALKQTMMDRHGRRSLLDGTESVTIDTYVHVLHAPDGTGNLTDAVVLQQMRVLNEGYATTPFTFLLQDINRVENQQWFENGLANETLYKPQLRQGDAGTLNIYFADLSDGGKGGLLGFATFPFWVGIAPELDGVVNDYRTVPGGRYTQFNEGKTTTHEVS